MNNMEEEKYDWEKDYEYDCAIAPLKYGRKVRLASENYYKKMLEKEGDIKKFYYDQLYSTAYFGDRKMFSTWLPFGIHRMDAWYTLRIHQLGLPNPKFNYSVEELELMILKNPHLHNIIKSNLISNLNSTKIINQDV
jgi:hypothetical protein